MADNNHVLQLTAAQLDETLRKVPELEGTVNKLSEEKVVKYSAQTLTEEEKAQARKNIGVPESVLPTDKDLLEKGYTLDYGTDLNYEKMWIGSGALYDVVGTDRFSTRKFQTDEVPLIFSEFSVHETCEYYFFSGNSVVTQRTYSALSEANWKVDFAFTHVAVNFTWGCSHAFTNHSLIKLYFPVAKNNGGYADKKVLVLGDSISTDYYGDYTKWVTNLVNDGFFPSNVTNSSLHATGFVARYTAEDANATNDFINRIEGIQNKDTFDLVVIFGGINDYIQAIPMGESGGDKLTSFIPAVDYFFEYLVNNFTQARIVVLSPLRTYNVYKNTAGHHQTEYADYIKEVAKHYCLPVLNLTEESGFCPFVDAFKNMWTLIPSGYTSADGVHPNAEYQQKFLAPMIKEFLLSVNPN